MSKASSPQLPSKAPAVVDPWHIYALLGISAAAAAVWVSRSTLPLALILISAAALAAALVALALHRALSAFWGKQADIVVLGERQREILEREKMLIMRAIKELEFDHAMGKMGEADYADLGARLRTRALSLMQDLEQIDVAAGPRMPERVVEKVRGCCAQCGTVNDPDASFCKHCGARQS